MAIPKPKKKSNVSIKKLEKKLKSLLYPLIKERDGNVCVSCGKQGLKGRDWQAGHYIKAELCNLIYRYDPLNISSQCSGCNLFKRGGTIEYRKTLIHKIGEQELERLEKHYRDKLPMNFNSRKWLEDEIKYYKTVIHLTQTYEKNKV